MLDYEKMMAKLELDNSPKVDEEEMAKVELEPTVEEQNCDEDQQEWIDVPCPMLLPRVRRKDPMN